jgi:hypothetical protein
MSVNVRPCSFISAKVCRGRHIKTGKRYTNGEFISYKHGSQFKKERENDYGTSNHLSDRDDHL